MAAKLAPEGIDIEQAYQALAEADPADTLDVFSGTSGTKRSWHRTFSPYLPAHAIGRGHFRSQSPAWQTAFAPAPRESDRSRAEGSA